jgi:hypothetical protein
MEGECTLEPRIDKAALESYVGEGSTFAGVNVLYSRENFVLGSGFADA